MVSPDALEERMSLFSCTDFLVSSLLPHVSSVGWIRMQGKDIREGNVDAIEGNWDVPRDMVLQFHVLPPVRQEVRYPPADGVRYAQQGEVVIQQTWDDGNEGSPLKGPWHRFLRSPGAGG